MTVDAVFRLANDSGGVLYVIAAMLLIALTVIIERLNYLYRVTRRVDVALIQIDRIESITPASLSACAEEFRGTPIASLIRTASRFARHTSRDDLSAHLEETIMREAPRVDRFLWVLDTIVTLAPLLGLFGTIVGMFNAFQVLSNTANAPTQVTGGVAQALVATASGLFVAMVGLVFFNGLHNRVRVVIHQLEVMKVALVNRIVHAPNAHAATLREVSPAMAGSIATHGASA
ncbi:biopolymer transport protein ExbB [Pararobbsia alpina]|uniref:MotA/TolQ/ExbB proton channel family protein n=1 Tax=Pararobbsia alpina TaxID=621374 RepID=UPI0039A6F781